MAVLISLLMILAGAVEILNTIGKPITEETQMRTIGGMVVIMLSVTFIIVYAFFSISRRPTCRVKMETHPLLVPKKR
jgi:hypothetical protein